MNRKLIRPNLSELKDKLGIPAKGGGGEVMTPAPPALTAGGEPNPAANPAAATAPQGLGSPNRVKEPNVLVPKHNIKYIYKQEEEPRIRRSRTAKKEEALAAEVELPVYD